MILAFQQLVAAGGSPKASELAGGIATALVCTFWAWSWAFPASSHLPCSEYASRTFG